jgi:multiple sugar transport system permease protein
MTTAVLRRRKINGTSVAPYIFISPFFLLYTLFMVVPIGAGFYLSLTDWAGLGTPRFVGLANYTRLFADERFLASLGNTGIFTVFALAVVLPASLLIATALNARGLHFRDFFRTLYFLPVVLSPVIVALVFGLIFDGDKGLFNVVMDALFGLPGIPWLTDGFWAKVVVVVLVLWRWTGYLTIFFLAGLQAIPDEQYEAAELDGAGPIRRFYSVTLPNLKPVTSFIFVTMLVATAQIFEEPFLLTSGGPGSSTLSAAMFIYEAAFQQQRLGFASAAGVVLFAIIFVLGRLSNWVLRVGRDD